MDIINLELYNVLIDILNENNYNYIIDKEYSLECIAIGIGDILFKLLNLQENLVGKPVYINLDIFQSGCYKMNYESEKQVWLDNPYNNFIFRIKLLNDIIKNSSFFEKKDFIFVITKFNAVIISNTNNNFNYNKIQNYKLLVNDNFYTNNTINNSIQKFIQEPFVIFHTKLRLNKQHDYNDIKSQLNIFFYNLKVNKFNIILLGEQKFKNNFESNIHGITTIYQELLKLHNFNSNKILDLTKEYIYNELNYDEYKNDIYI